MAATGHFSRNDDEVIIVTLVCRPHDSQISAFPKRQFILSNENPSIRIGRASKVPTKGFVASIDNAWFDSPVMSRNHAELVLDLDSIPKSVVIKDIGSLHGTFHIPHDGVGKEMRLEQQRPVRLSNGDSLRFGTDIFRAKETFPPYSVEFYMVGQEHEPCSQDVPTTNQSPNRTFTIPDDDLDDEDDDDESVVETCMPPSRNTNIQRGLSIDLTQDEDDSDEDQHVASNATAPNHFNSDVIDLTSEPDEHSDHEIHDRCPSHSSASATIDVPSIPALVTAFASYNHELLAGMEQSEKHTALDVEPDASSEHDYSFPHDEDMGSEDIHLTDSEDGSILIGGDDMSSMDEDSDDDDSPASMFNDDVVRSDSWGSDNESILPYSESDDDSSSSDDEMMDPLSNSSSRAPSSSPFSSPNPPLPNGLPNSDTFAESTNTEDVFVAPFLFTTSTQQGASVVQPREPSPSDAAMFKSHPVLDRTASISRAQALGEKSGKHAFFAARESNRMNLDWNSPPPVSAIRETLAADADTDQHITDVESDHASHTALPVVRVDDGQKSSTGGAADVNNAPEPTPNGPTTILSEEPIPDPTWQPWSVSGERFLNHPRIEELPSNPERPQSPDFDMTSAYTFQLSKIASETSAASLASKPRRVEIQDLLTQEPNGDNNTNDDPITPHIFSTASSAPLPTSECVPEPNLKRSFDDAFSNDEDVIGLNEECISREDDKSKSMSSNRRTRNDEVTNVESNEATAPETPEQDSIEAQPAIIPARRDNVQPSKRRRFAQAAAYVALGGAAAFTYMVSTAPVL